MWDNEECCAITQRNSVLATSLNGFTWDQEVSQTDALRNRQPTEIDSDTRQGILSV